MKTLSHIVAQKTTDQLYDIGMTICDLLENNITSALKARKIVELVQYAFRVSLQKIKCTGNMEPIEYMAAQGRAIEKSLLGKIFANFEFGTHEACKVERIVRSCFKNFYYREKEYSSKVNCGINIE